MAHDSLINLLIKVALKINNMSLLYLKGGVNTEYSLQRDN